MNKKISFIFITFLISLCVIFSGCDKNSDSENSTEISNRTEVQTEEDSQENSQSSHVGNSEYTTGKLNGTTEDTNTSAQPQQTTPADNSAATKTIIIVFSNETDTDFGMIAVIDPVTNKQAEVGGLTAGDTLKLEANWPKSVKNLQWAVYNLQGQRYMEGTTDLSTVSSSVTITMTGSQKIEEVKTDLK